MQKPREEAEQLGQASLELLNQTKTVITRYRSINLTEGCWQQAAVLGWRLNELPVFTPKQLFPPTGRHLCFFDPSQASNRVCF